MRILVWLVLCVSIALTIFPSPLLAQQVTPQTKKNVVRNFKADLSQYSAFGTDCSQKPRGDANCDGTINQFDLSIWEVEFNSRSSPRRSDFNNDGVVNLLDFGIWRNTVYPAPKITQAHNSKFLSTLINLISKQYPITQLGFRTFSHFLDQLGQLEIRNYISTVYAQESASGGGEINSSSTFVSGSGNSLVVNSITGGNTQQVNFDAQGNPVSAAFYNTNGQSYAEVAFTQTGGTIISTEESGIPVTINKTASGPIIENFRNPDGTLLAIKSWPTQASYDRNEPPLSVTIPGPNQTKEVLNIQPNADSIVEKLDQYGNILSRTQLRANDTIVTEDLRNKTLTQSNSQLGFTTLSMKNNLGGSSDYMFYQGGLYAIAQSDDKKNAYIAKPLDSGGDSWTFETLEDGVKRSEKIVSNPITEVKGNTPDPKALIQYINYYKQTQPSTTAVNFSDGFTSTSGVSTQIQKANNILTISQTQAPSVLGLTFIKEALAAGYESEGENIDNGETRQGHHNFRDPATGDWISTQVNGSTGNGQVTVEVTFGNPTTNPGGTTYQFSGDRATFEGLGVQPGTGSAAGQPMDVIDVTNVLNAGRSGTVSSSVNGGTVDDLTSIPSIVTTTNPAAPPQTEPAPAPANYPSLGLGTGTSIPDSVKNAAAQASDLSNEQGGTPTQNALAAYAAAKAAGANTNQASVLFADSYMVSAIRDVKGEEWDPTGLDMVTEARNAGINTTDLVNNGLQALNAQRSADGAEAVTPTSIQSFAGTSTPDPAALPSTAAAAAAAPVAAGISTPTSSFIAPGVYSSVGVVVNNLLNPTGMYQSTITGADHGTAIQYHNPVTGFSSWTDDRGTFTSNSGLLTGASYTGGGSYAITSDGLVVDVSALGASAFDPNGQLNADVEAVAREHSLVTDQSIIDTITAQAIENYQSQGGVPSGGLLSNYSTCFLPGTKISTPSGFKNIEDFKPGDKVYSYNEKTGAKEISGFNELDINFVDEYLIINNRIKATVYHPFYIVSGNSLKTVRADELNIGDLLQNEAGKSIPVYSIEKISAPKTTVYNLNNVSKNNNFYAEGILVHNYGGAGQDFSSDPGSQNLDSWSEGGWSSGSTDGYSGNNVDEGGNFGGESGGNSYSDDSGSYDSGGSFNNDTSNGSDGNSSGGDSSGW